MTRSQRGGKSRPASQIVWISPEDLRRERQKARQLRQTQWWKRKVADGICYYCGQKFDPEELTMDHVVPLVRGGKSSRGNCVACCKECNSKKQALVPVEWEAYVKGLRDG